MKMKLPAVQVKQPLGTFWAVSIPAKILLACASLDPTRVQEVDRSSFFYKLIGNQREASSKRAKEIGIYINSEDAAFPNSIILGANYTNVGPLADESPLRWTLQRNGDSYFIEIPEIGKSVVVIDGQHRLFGFEHATSTRMDMELLCSVYFDLPQSYQAYLFATININQRKVDKSLAYEQFGYNLDHEESIGWAPEKVAVALSRRLNLDPNSPLYQKIKLAPLDGDKVFPNIDPGWQVSTACVVEGILSLISSKPKQDRDNLHAQPLPTRRRTSLGQDSSPFRDIYRTSKDDKLLDLLAKYFGISSRHLWQKSTEKSYIKKTVGVQALFDVLRHLGLKYTQDDIVTRAETILAACTNIDFANEFFQASGKGRVRIKNTILWASQEIPFAQLPQADLGAYANFAQSCPGFPRNVGP